MKKILLLLALLAGFASTATAQYTVVTATVEDPTGAIYSGGTYTVQFVDPGTSGQLPLLNGNTFQKVYAGLVLDSFGNFSITLPDNNVIGTSSGELNTQWNFSICSSPYAPNNKTYCFQYTTTVTGAGMNISSALRSVAATLPSSGGGGGGVSVNGNPVTNPNFNTGSSVAFSVIGSNITATAAPIAVHGSPVASANLIDSATVTFTVSGGNISATSTGGGSGSPASPNQSVQINNSGVFGAGPLVSAVALNAVNTDGVCYYGTSGNDSNSGESAGLAKLTELGCYDALPAAGGTIYVLNGQGSGPACSPVSGQGLGFAGPLDPNYGSLPAGWRQAKSFTLRALSGTLGEPNGVSGITAVTLCGNGGAGGNTAVTVNDVNGIDFEGINYDYATTSYRFGWNSAGNRAGGEHVNNTVVHGAFLCNFGNDPSLGPPIDDGSGILWQRLEDIEACGNSDAAAGTAQRACFNLDPGASGAASGLIRLYNYDCINGGIRVVDEGTSPGSITGQHLFEEGISGTNAPLVDLQLGSNGGLLISHWEDIPGVTDESVEFAPTLRNYYGAQKDNMSLDYYSGVVEGPGRIMNGSIDGVFSLGPNLYSVNGVPIAFTSPLSKDETGEYGSHNLDQEDAFRSQFVNTHVTFLNDLQGSTQLGSGWAAGAGTGVSINTGATSPDGLTNGVSTTCTADSVNDNCSVTVFNQNVTLNADDYIVAAVYAQQGSTNGIYQGFGFYSPLTLQINFNTSPSFQLIAGNANPVIAGTAPDANPGVNTLPQDDSSPQWIWGVWKVLEPYSGGASNVAYSLYYSHEQPMIYSYPMFIHIPASFVARTGGTCTATFTESGNTVSATSTSGSCPVTVGQPIVVTGASPSGYNVGGPTVVVTDSIDPTHFQFYNPNSGLGAGTGATIHAGGDSWAAWFARNLVPYSEQCLVGTNCGVQGIIDTATAALTVLPVAVASLPTAAVGNAGQIRMVNDSTTISAEGQTCVGSSTGKALAFSTGSVWKCF